MASGPEILTHIGQIDVYRGYQPDILSYDFYLQDFAVFLFGHSLLNTYTAFTENSRYTLLEI